MLTPEATTERGPIEYRSREPHDKQSLILASVGEAKRIVARCGRRFGKSVLAAMIAVEALLNYRRVLYAVPTEEQLDIFWYECKRALAAPIADGRLYKLEGRHIIEDPGTPYRIRGKTAWNADNLRGDWADYLILDEFQLMNKDAWELVGAPMLLDNDGDAVFLFTQTPGRNHSKALLEKARAASNGRWAAFSFPSHDNPHLSEVALANITDDMTQMGYRMEILSEDVEDNPRAPWNRDEDIEPYRVTSHPRLKRIVVAVDPPGGATECGIMVCGLGFDGHGYLLSDPSLKDTPAKWGAEVLTAYNKHQADRVIGEVNYGGDMVENTVRSVLDEGETFAYKDVRATRGKVRRAEPVAALYEKGLIHHVGQFPEAEDEMCSYVEGESKWSPNRMDALVWGFTELMVGYTMQEIPEQEEKESDFYEGPVTEGKSRWKKY